MCYQCNVISASYDGREPIQVCYKELFYYEYDNLNVDSKGITGFLDFVHRPAL
jgi:hypothetical protein